MRQPSRFALLAPLLIPLLLSGCLSGVGSPDGLDAHDASDEPAPPEPVRILHRIDLSQGLPETSWSMEVAPGYTEGRVVARMEGPEGSSMLTSTGWCYRFEGRQDDGSAYGTSGGDGCRLVASHYLGSARDFVHLEGDDFGSGWYRFTFSAQPSVAVLVVEMVADYGHGASGADHDAHA